MSSEKAETNDGTLVAAWKRGGYCLTRRSCISQVPYLGVLSFAGPFCVWTWGSYTNSSSDPDSGSMTGGRKVSGVCGMWKVKVLTWRPILERASMRAGLVKVDDLKVVVTDSKSKGAARVDMSWQTRRRLARSSASICSSMLSRHLSFNQNRRKTELVDSTRLHTEP